MLNTTADRRGFDLSRRALAALAALLAVPAAFPATRPADEALQQRLDATIDRALSERRVVGTVVIVLREGTTVYHRAAGFLDREARTPMPENTIFRLASSSKAITSAAAMALIERGRLGLDDPVTRWLPDFHPKAPDGSTPPITVRQLLTHTSGLSYPFWETEPGPYRRARVSSGLDQPGLSMEEELRRIATAGLALPPGKEWRYSLSIDVLGAVIEKAARQSLPDAVRALVTGPLAMADTGFRVRERERLAVAYASATPQPVRMADGQAVDFGEHILLTFTPSRALNDASFPSGGGGMVGTAADFARFLEAIRTGGGHILKPATVKAMMTNQTGTMPIVTGPGWGFGFGAAVVTDSAAAATPLPPGTWSWSGAYGTSWFTDPTHHLTVVAFTDTSPEGDSGPFAMAIRDAVYGTRTH